MSFGKSPPIHLAAQVVQRGGWRWASSSNDAKGDTSSRGDGRFILQSEPPRVDVTQDRAASLAPVGLGVGNRGNGGTVCWASNRPTGLSHPDLLAPRSRDCSIVGAEESGVTVCDAVGLGVLVVWVGIHAEEVGSINHGLVAAIDPRGPGVDVANWLSSCASASDGGSNLSDIGNDRGWFRTRVGVGGRPGGCESVQIFRTDGDAGNQIGEGSAVGADGTLQGGELIGKACVASACPHAQEKGCLRIDGGLDGSAGGVCAAALDHGRDERR